MREDVSTEGWIGDGTYKGNRRNSSLGITERQMPRTDDVRMDIFDELEQLGHYREVGEAEEQDQEPDMPFVAMTRASEPVVCIYPIVPSTGEPDTRVMKWKYEDYPSPVINEDNPERIQHMSLRFWLSFFGRNEGGSGERFSNFDTDSREKDAHDANLRHILKTQNTGTQEFIEAITFYYGTTKPKTLQGSNANPQQEVGGRGRDYVDIKLPMWNELVVRAMTEPGALNTNQTLLEYAGDKEGRGPIAHPRYAIAQMDVPRRTNDRPTSNNYESFLNHVTIANASFIGWRDRHGIRHEIVAWGGFFTKGNKDLPWDLRLFAVYRVPVSDQDLYENNLSNLKSEHQKFPAFTVFGKMQIRNSMNFRFSCGECKYDAAYIHNVEGHRCAHCNKVGHFKRNCESIRRPTSVKRKYYEVVTYSSAPEAGKNLHLLESLKQDPEMMEFERRARAKRARTEKSS